ncbi:Malonyl-[acyl-carrier protein] O-methyltransferase [Trichinella spiralis]|uniref:Malonyl-[acyl-carrier protein] O-methyltransferase n=1 Tax=Trichinella spiralis TaxID=6334 RepID=A0ABR3KF85_TRISP
MAKEMMKKLDARLAFMSECMAELCESETISGGQDADLERVLQEVRCSSARGQRENPSGDSPVKSNAVLNWAWLTAYRRETGRGMVAQGAALSLFFKNVLSFVKFWKDRLSMEALSIFQQVNTGQRECGHDTRHSAFSTKKLFSCIYPDALASYALVVTLLKKRSVPLEALENEHVTASLSKFRWYIEQNSLGEPTPTEWRSLYKDRLKRLLDDTESHLRRLTAIAEVLGMGN